MKVASIQKLSLIEYPGKLSAVIFIPGCNLRCQFCYVPDLVLPERVEKVKPIPEKKVFSFLKERKGFLEAVAISGGEPTIHSELPEFIKKIKRLGYLVELETNGTNFKMLKKLVEEKLIDYVATDIKHDFDFELWNEITGGVLTPQLFENIKKSINFLLEGKIDYELRTTLMKEFHKKEDIVEICKKIRKAKVYYLQNYEKTESGTVSGKEFTPFSEKEILEIIEEGKKYTNIKARPYLFK
ncbi:anaerobic ribonucleoside-triphosphate reductase activating protein [bacterium]|nr:anaerobic ribonucleoside-triphosphate reductase activating protein [bacterium]